ncbi:MAG: hypothetical protein FWH51_03015 [Dehalococcoidia bacterium]|nr:hypothetical protein [Dehalococcoidia bacterium]
MKKPMTILLIAALLVLLFPILIPMACLPLSSCLQPNPPRPEITYGEFPFKLVYELNGEEITIEDTIICEFDGFGFSWGGGDKWLKWKSHLASGKKSPSPLAEVSLKISDTHEVYFFLGGPKYYMGVEAGYVLNFHAFRIQEYSFGGQSYPMVSEDELLDVYGIKLVSWKPSPPIVNSFK